MWIQKPSQKFSNVVVFLVEYQSFILEWNSQIVIYTTQEYIVLLLLRNCLAPLLLRNCLARLYFSGFFESIFPPRMYNKIFCVGVGIFLNTWLL